MFASSAHKVKGDACRGHAPLACEGLEHNDFILIHGLRVRGRARVRAHSRMLWASGVCVCDVHFVPPRNVTVSHHCFA